MTDHKIFHVTLSNNSNTLRLRVVGSRTAAIRAAKKAAIGWFIDCRIQVFDAAWDVIYEGYRAP